MKLGQKAAAGGVERRRCSSVGRRYDNGIINQSQQPNNRPRNGRLPRLAAGTTDSTPAGNYPGSTSALAHNRLL